MPSRHAEEDWRIDERTSTMMMWPMPDDGFFSDNQRRAHGSLSPDVRLTRQVAEALLADQRTSDQRITIEVQDGVVLLDGAVDCPRTRRAVAAAARDVSGVREVCNRLRTRTRPGLLDEDPVAGTEQSDDLVFDQMVAALRVDARRSDRTPHHLVSMISPVLAAITAVLLGGLVIMLGWPALLVACVAAVVGIEMFAARTEARRTTES